MHILKIQTHRIVALTLLAFLAVPQVVFGTNIDVGDGKIDNPLSVTSLSDFIAAFVDVARDIGILVATIGIVYSGFLHVTAQGDEEKLKKGKKAFWYSILGTAVILGAWMLTTAIQGTVQTIGG